MKPITQATILTEARRLIEQPEHWTRHTFARDAHGDYVRAGTERAVSFCMAGAVSRAICNLTGYHDESAEHDRLTDPAYQRLNEVTRPYSFATLNDDEQRTSHADVLAIMDRAIALAQEH